MHSLLSACAMALSAGCLLRRLPNFICVGQIVRHKHYDIKWRELRKAKVLKVDLPDFDKIRNESKMSPEEFRSFMKSEGHMPPRQFKERPLILASTGAIIEPYVPQKGDGILSSLSVKGAKDKVKKYEMEIKSMLKLRKIRQFEPEFDPKMFPATALEIYKEAFNLLEDSKTNEMRLHELLTEKAYPEIIWKLDKKTFKWRFIESIEPPKVVHIRCQEMLSKENVYAQVTVRFNSKMLTAIYDRFGRLSFGSENHPFEMVEYVVFEKHLSNEYGSWRIHGKITPEWKTKELAFTPITTFVKPKLEAIEPMPGKKEQETTVN